MSRIRIPENRPKTRERFFTFTLKTFVNQFQRGEISKSELNTRILQSLEKHYDSCLMDIEQYFTGKGFAIELSKLNDELTRAKTEWRKILADL